MEKYNGLKWVKEDGGVVALPPGFWFEPTEEEIVFQYLYRKTFSLPLPAYVIPHLPIHTCRYDPWDFPGDIDQEDRYFFSNKECTQYQKGNQTNIMSPNGYWKPTTSSEKRITNTSTPNNNNNNNNSTPIIMGMKKTLVFYYGKPPHAYKTHWVMHEYRLVAPVMKKDHYQGSLMQQIGNVVLCRVFQKKRVNGNSSDGEIAEVCGDNYINNSSNNGLIMSGSRSDDDDNDDGNSCDSSSSSSSSRVIYDDEVSSSHFSSGILYY